MHTKIGIVENSSLFYSGHATKAISNYKYWIPRYQVIFSLWNSNSNDYYLLLNVIFNLACFCCATAQQSCFRKEIDNNWAMMLMASSAGA